MLATFPAPVLSVAADAVRDLEGHDALSGLWTREWTLCPPLVFSRPDTIQLSVYEMQRIAAGGKTVGEYLVEVVVPRDDDRGGSVEAV